MPVLLDFPTARRLVLRWAYLAAPLAALASLPALAHAQAAAPVPAVPPTTQSPPAEITPSHPADDGTASGSPQTAVPRPLPPSANPDTPGGSARNGVIKPPPLAGDKDIIMPPPATGSMPVIPPSETLPGKQPVVPK